MPAIWTPPRTWNLGELVTDALLNTHVRDNLEYLKSQRDGQATTLTNHTNSINSHASTLSSHASSIAYLQSRIDIGMNTVGAVYGGDLTFGASGSFVLAHTSLSLSLATNGAPVLIGFSGTWNVHSASAEAMLDVAIDGARIGNPTYGLIIRQFQPAGLSPVSWTGVRSLGAGSHTFGLYVRSTGGNLSLTGSLGGFYFYVVELLK